MISKYRNRGVVGILLGIVFFVIAALVVENNRHKGFSHRIPNKQILVLVLSIIFGHIAYLWGCFSLARAKGQNSGLVMTGFILLAFCMPIIALAVALGVALGMDDKMRGHNRVRR